MRYIQSTYINALLADASYVRLQTGDEDTPPTGVVSLDVTRLGNRLAASLTQPQANRLLSNFEILTQTLSPSEGFDAVVWRGKSGTDYAGQVYVSLRGTQGAQDILDDVSLASRGVPYEQLRDMANWWMRVTAKAGETVKQIRVDSAVTPLLNSFTFAAGTPVVATGELYGQVNTITGVNGHSLGGYLATAFTRLFGAKVSQVNTFNSAGFSDAAGSNIRAEFNNIETLLGSSALGTRSLDAAGLKQTNFRAGNGVSVTTNNWGEMPYWALGFNQYGKKIALYQEDTLGGNPIANHSMFKLTDYLALGAALEKLVPTLTFDQLNAIVQAASNDMEASLESVLDAVRRIVTGTDFPITRVGDVGGDAVSRGDFHSHLAELQASAPYKKLIGNVNIISLAATSGAAILSAAQQAGAIGMAYRYALVTGTPFVVTGADYSAANTNGKLDLFDKASGTGKLTQQYLSDRANYMVWKISKNNADASYGSTISSDTTEGDWDYTDMAAKVTLKVDGRGGLLSTAHQIIFGTDTADTLTGKDQSDHLYGGDGDDTLIGGDGADYLEGGNGVDIYQAADGDVLFDADSQGVVTLAGKRLGGATQRLSEHRWRGADGEIYTRNGDDLEVALDSQRITIRNGYLRRLTAPGGVLGLALTGEVATPSTDGRVYTGSSLRDIWEWQRIYGVGYYETTGRETFRMGAGDDQVASVGGGDIFYGEDGNDVFIATDGDNVGEGGM